MSRMYVYRAERQGGLRRRGFLLGPHERGRAGWKARIDLPQLDCRGLAIRTRRLSVPKCRLERLARQGGEGLARSFGAAGRFEQEPDAPFGLVDPDLNQARGRDIAVLVADVMRLAQEAD